MPLIYSYWPRVPILDLTGGKKGAKKEENTCSLVLHDIDSE